MAASVSRGPRRVLGEKDRNTLVAAVGVGLSKPPTANATTTLSPKAGHKRKIDAVECEEHGDPANSQLSIITQPLSSPSDAMYEVEPETAGDEPAQSEPPSDPPRDSYFEIHEEVSQRALDKLHAVSLSQPPSQDEPNEPSTLLPPAPLSLAQETSEPSVSMSSLIGYDEKEDGEGEDEDEKQQQQQQQQRQQQNSIKEAEAQAQAEQDRRRAEAVAERAQRLRTRLQLAYYKVTTNQASTPFSRLAALQRQRQRQQQYSQTVTATAATSTRARLLSPPQILPAAYGGRSRYTGADEDDDDEDDEYEWTAVRMNAAATPRQAIRPDDSNSAHLSSVVKGQAADLLLQLNRASVTPGRVHR